MTAQSASVGKQYMLDRGFRESARLHVQHWMWGQAWGFQLNPQIPNGEELSIVDVGAGNCCWLIELAQSLPPKSRLVGLDVSRSQFPSQEFLPANIELRTADVFADIPEDLVGQFDVVHLRAFSAIVKGGDPSPLIKNVVKMLKPNGYLQWDELDCASFSAHSPGPQTSKANTDLLLQRWQEFAAKSDLQFPWVSSMREIFQALNLEVVHSEKRPTPPTLYKPSTDDFALALDDIGRIATSRDPSLLGTPEEWKVMYENMLAEIRTGISITMDMVECLGRVH